MDVAAAHIPEIATAVVIGVGGSGVHTLARLQAAVRDPSRPGHVAIDNVKFLAIDALEQNAQLPPLPPNTGLASDEFFNIAAKPINAQTYVRQAQQHDDRLADSWDQDYNAPNQLLTDGMKRSRALGNLVFRVHANEVESAVRQAINDAVSLDPEHTNRGTQGSPGRLRVFIVASCAGGTGSSGFLHVLHAVHRAAKASSIDAAVYPVIFLPDVFVGARLRSIDPHMEERAHRSNAYAFLAELDYVISVRDAFDDLLLPNGKSPTHINEIDVIETAYLIDGRLSDGHLMGQEDAYALAASGLHALLLTKARSVIGTAGTNTDVKGYDAITPKQRTAYAAMGSVRVVYPGSTYRRYALAKTRAYVLKGILIDDAESTNAVQRGGPIARQLAGAIWGLRTQFDETARSLESVRDLYSRLNDIPGELEGGDVVRSANDHFAVLQADAERAAKDLADVLPAAGSKAIDDIDTEIDKALKESGEGLKVLIYAVGAASRQIKERAKELDIRNDQARQTVSSLLQAERGESLADKLRDIDVAAGRNILVRRGELRDAVAQYADTASLYANSVVGTYVSQEELNVAEAAQERLNAVLKALESAKSVLEAMNKKATATSVDDELEGKDAGGRLLTALVPSDVLPEVEESHIAQSAWALIEKSLSGNLSLTRVEQATPSGPASTGLEWLRRLYATWWERGADRGVRGLVSLGQGETDALSQSRSQDILEVILQREVAALADLSTVLPPSIEAAAKRADAAASGDLYGSAESGEELRKLNIALQETAKRSHHVSLSIDLSRIKLQGDTALPMPLVFAAASGDMLNSVSALDGSIKAYDSGDPEQVVFLTLQRGLPISAVQGLSMWYDAFRSVNQGRAKHGATSIDPPPFLDKIIAAKAAQRPLVRRAYTDDDVARSVVEGTALADLVKSDADRAGSLGTGLKEAALPLWSDYADSVGGGRMMWGRSVIVSDGEATASGQEIKLGSTPAQIFDRLARENQIRVAIETVYDLVLAKALRKRAEGDATLVEAMGQAVDDYRARNDKRLSELPRDSPSEETQRERETRSAISRAAETVVAELRRQERPERPEQGI